jgi:dolichol kinase
LDFVEFCVQYYGIFVIFVQCYLIAFGVIVLNYSQKTKYQQEKIHCRKYRKNELVTGSLFLIIAGIYPFIFNNLAIEEIRAQIYFHIWDSLTVNFVLWLIFIPLWKSQDKKKSQNTSQTEWITQLLALYEGKNETRNLHKNYARKKIHFIYAAIIIGLHYLGVILTAVLIFPPNWNGTIISVWLMVCVILNYLWIMIIFDIARLVKFESMMSKFMRDGAINSLKKDELFTFTSAHVLLLALLPFVLFEPIPQIFYTVWLITAISDAMASIIGMRFGKVRSKRVGVHKSLEGYIAGWITTYLIVLGVHLLIPFPTLNWITVQILAIGVATAFLIVDLLNTEISDNMLNPVVCGIVMWILINLLLM